MPEDALQGNGRDDEFSGLVLRYLDGLTTDEDHRMLEVELRSPERRDLFVGLCRQRGMLTEALGAQRASEAFREREAVATGRRRRPARLARSAAGSSGRAYGAAAAIAAGFLVVLILSSVLGDKPSRPIVPPAPRAQAKAPPAPEPNPAPKSIVKKPDAPRIRPASVPQRTPPAPPKVSAPVLPPAPPRVPAPPKPKSNPKPANPPAPRPSATTVAAARVDRVSGEATAIAGTTRIPLRKGVMVEAGQGIETRGTGSDLSLVYPDGSRLDFGADTRASRLDVRKGKEIDLAFGTTTVEAARQPAGQPMILTTPHAIVRVLGTRFTLNITPSGTRLDVTEGRVRLTRRADGASVEVKSGHFALAGPPGPLTSTAIPGSKPPILLVVGNAALSPGDRAIKARLERLGHTVAVKADVNTSAADTNGMALVILSSTSGSTTIGRTFRTLGVPVMTWEAWLYDDLGMTGPGRLKDYGNLPGEQSELVILSPTHPMAAGLSMKVAVSPPHDLMWGRPNANALVIAVLAKDVNRAALFGYEKGARMPGGFAAPARRLGFFLPDNTPDILNDNGWALFDAAVAWGSEVRPSRRRR